MLSIQRESLSIDLANEVSSSAASPSQQAKQPFRLLHLNFRSLSLSFLSPTHTPFPPLPNKYPLPHTASILLFLFLFTLLPQLRPPTTLTFVILSLPSLSTMRYFDQSSSPILVLPPQLPPQVSLLVNTKTYQKQSLPSSGA